VGERRADPSSGVFDGSPALLDGCAAASQALDGCRLLLLTATAAEAAPLLAHLEDAEHFELAGKAVATGRLRTGSGGGGEPIPVALAIGGCDKTNTAHILTSLLQAMRPLPGLVMQVGIAGAFQDPDGAYPEPGDVVLATEEIYADSGSSSPRGWLSADDLGLPVGKDGGCDSGISFTFDEDLVRAAAGALERTGVFAVGTVAVAGRPRVFSGRCLTASRVTGLAAEAAALLERWGALAESMEGAAAAHICALYGVPFLEVRGISNVITDRDRASWQVERAVSVAAEAALAICTALDAGERGDS
jgi:futalosine hydrolase